MELLDVNVLVNAYRQDAPEHRAFTEYVERLANGVVPFAVPSVVLGGFLRIVTHPRIFSPPSTLDDALTFADQVRALPHCILLTAGTRHADIFVDLCRAGDARGNLVSDAYLAALAIETGSELVTADRGFARWPGLRYRHPS